MRAKSKSGEEGLGAGQPVLSRPSLSFLGPPALVALFVVLAGLLLLAAREKRFPATGSVSPEPEVDLGNPAPPLAPRGPANEGGPWAAPKVQPQVAQPGVELKLEAIEETWLSISADGGDQVRMLLQPGAKRTWKALRGFTLTVGNAGGVRVTLDGTGLPLLGASGQVLREVDLRRGWRRGSGGRGSR